MLSTPDVTPAQVIAVIGAVIGVAAAAGLPLSTALQASSPWSRCLPRW